VVVFVFNNRRDNGRFLMRRQRGLTLVELMMTLAVVAILAALAVPSMGDIIARNRLKGAAERLKSELFQLRSEAIARNRTIRLSVTRANGGAEWCYGMRIGASCVCHESITVNDASYCAIDGVKRVVAGSGFPGVHIISMSGVAATTSTINGQQYSTHPLSFTPLRGTATNSTIVLESATTGQQIRLVVSSVGRIKICSPSGATKVEGYESC
jgi:type IV fimbrial biogenesis protein FimT